MSIPSIIVGEGNWAGKSGNLLGYAVSDVKIVPREFTVSRALNTATRVNASGNIQAVNADIPRIDYFGGQASLLVEPSAANSFIESQTLFTTHLVQNLTTSGYTNATASPDGSVTAEKFVPNTTNGVHGIANGSSLAIASGTTYTLSLFVKSDGGPYNLISLTFDSSTAWGATRNCIFNAYNGTNFAVPSGATMTSENYGNGWYRIRATLTAVGTVAAATFQYRIYVADASGNLSWAAPSGNTNGVFCWGAQLETGSVATSYIPTTTGSVTRNADVINLTGATDYIGQTEGTMYVEFISPSVSAGRIYAIDNGPTITNRVSIFRETASRRLGVIVRSNTSVTNGSISSSAATAFNADVPNKTAYAYKSGDYALAINGAIAASGNLTFAFNDALSYTQIAAESGQSQGGPIRILSLALYTTRLPNDQLQALTTL